MIIEMSLCFDPCDFVYVDFIYVGRNENVNSRCEQKMKMTSMKWIMESINLAAQLDGVGNSAHVNT